MAAAASSNHYTTPNYNFPIECRECNIESLNIEELLSHLKQCPTQVTRIHCPLCDQGFTRNTNRNVHIRKQVEKSLQEKEREKNFVAEYRRLHHLGSPPPLPEPLPPLPDNQGIELNNVYPERMLENEKKTRVIKQQCTDKVMGKQRFMTRLRAYERTNLFALFLSNAVSKALFHTIIILIHVLCSILMDRVIEIVKYELQSKSVDKEFNEAFITELTKCVQSLRAPFPWLKSTHLVDNALENPDTFVKPITQQFMTNMHSRRQVKAADRITEDEIPREAEAKSRTYEEIMPRNYSRPMINRQGYADGEDWRMNKLVREHPDRTYVALNLAYDDIRLTDKGHRKQGIFAMSILNLPSYYSVCPVGQMLVAQGYTEDWTAMYQPESYTTEDGTIVPGEKERTGYDIFFRRWSKQIRDLEDVGMMVMTKNGPLRVYPTLAMVTGDNLAVHCLFNYCQNFSKCNYQCVHCLTTAGDFKRNDILIKETRTERVYKAQVAHVQRQTTKADFRKAVASTGIYGDCSIKTRAWGPWSNHYLDVMHDCDEGSPHVMFHLLLSAAIRNKLITAEQINECMQSFKWGAADSNNRVNKLNPDALVGNWLQMDLKTGEMKCKRAHLGLKAAQFYAVLRLFPAIVPPSKFDRNSLVWKCLAKLRSVVMFLHANSFTDEQLLRYAKYYASLIDDCVMVCGAKCTIKTHNLLHYVEIMRWIGPAIQRSSYALERLLGQVSRLAKSLNNYVNLSKSSALRFQQRHAIRLASGMGDPDVYRDLGKSFIPIPDELMQFMSSDDQELLSGARLSREFRLRGTIYKRGTYMMLGWIDDIPEIAEICGMIINNDSTIMDDKVMMRSITTVRPRTDCTSAYIVNDNETNVVKLMDLRECEYYHPFSLYNSENTESSVYFHSDSKWIDYEDDMEWKDKFI